MSEVVEGGEELVTWASPEVEGMGALLSGGEEVELISEVEELGELLSGGEGGAVVGPAGDVLDLGAGTSKASL